jgi:hypothetical protein
MDFDSRPAPNPETAKLKFGKDIVPRANDFRINPVVCFRAGGDIKPDSEYKTPEEHATAIENYNMRRHDKWLSAMIQKYNIPQSGLNWGPLAQFEYYGSFIDKLLVIECPNYDIADWEHSARDNLEPATRCTVVLLDYQSFTWFVNHLNPKSVSYIYTPRNVSYYSEDRSVQLLENNINMRLDPPGGRGYYSSKSLNSISTFDRLTERCLTSGYQFGR